MKKQNTKQKVKELKQIFKEIRKQTAEEIFKELDDWWYEGGKSSFSTAEYEEIKKKYLGGLK